MISLGSGSTLLLGGARSGKSDLAVRAGGEWDGEVTFVATATAGDDDMAARITRHQQERPVAWQLLEASHFDAAAADAIAADHLVIVDCITLLVANLMFADRDEASIVDHVTALGAALAHRSAPSLIISNEVGLGIHPTTQMGRDFRDVLGRANRALASTCQTSLFVVAGKALPLHDLNF